MWGNEVSALLKETQSPKYQNIPPSVETLAALLELVDAGKGTTMVHDAMIMRLSSEGAKHDNIKRQLKLDEIREAISLAREDQENTHSPNTKIVGTEKRKIGLDDQESMITWKRLKMSREEGSWEKQHNHQDKVRLHGEAETPSHAPDIEAREGKPATTIGKLVDHRSRTGRQNGLIGEMQKPGRSSAHTDYPDDEIISEVHSNSAHKTYSDDKPIIDAHSNFHKFIVSFPPSCLFTSNKHQGEEKNGLRPSLATDYASIGEDLPRIVKDEDVLPGAYPANGEAPSSSAIACEMVASSNEADAIAANHLYFLASTNPDHAIQPTPSPSKQLPTPELTPASLALAGGFGGTDRKPIVIDDSRSHSDDESGIKNPAGCEDQSYLKSLLSRIHNHKLSIIESRQEITRLTGKEFTLRSTIMKNSDDIKLLKSEISDHEAEKQRMLAKLDADYEIYEVAQKWNPQTETIKAPLAILLEAFRQAKADLSNLCDDIYAQEARLAEKEKEQEKLESGIREAENAVFLAEDRIKKQQKGIELLEAQVK